MASDLRFACVIVLGILACFSVIEIGLLALYSHDIPATLGVVAGASVGGIGGILSGPPKG